MAVIPGESDSSWRGAVDAKSGVVVVVEEDDDFTSFRVLVAVQEDGCWTIKAGLEKPYAGVVSDDGNATVTIVDRDKNLMLKACCLECSRADEEHRLLMFLIFCVL